VIQGFLLIGGFCSGLDSELEGFALAVAFDGKFHTATFARLRRPGGLPKVVGGAVGGGDGDLGNTDYT
ncbi:MAG: hypothetical protein ACI9E1_001556, partial [Cryomorphaceae bacterium]